METGTISQTVIVGNRKNAFVAFLLSGLIAGLGQIYIGKGFTGISGLIYMAIWAVLFLAMIILTLFTIVGGLIVVPFILLLDLIAAIHAVIATSNYNKQLLK